MDIDKFIDGIKQLVEKSQLFADSDLEAVLLINITAGGFARPARFKKTIAELTQIVYEAKSLATRKPKTNFRYIKTVGPKHASNLANTFIEEAAIKPQLQWLIIIASGDGTSLEFLDELSRSPDEIRLRFTVLRFPMGTGNDGSDGRQFYESASRLLTGKIAMQPALRVIPSPSGPAALSASNGEWRSFNIASLGLDAYVTEMTNRLKKISPGNTYSLWVDVAAILYDKIYKVAPMNISVYTDTDILELEQKLLFMAMGISGHRTYGAGKAILPDDNNICVMRQMPFLRKLAVKGPASSGYINTIPEASMFIGKKVKIGYTENILAQMDGEVQKLCKDDFPLIIEKTEPVIRYISAAKS